MATKAMIHLNSNILCVVDVETTGLRAGYHDIIQICVLPLDSELKPSKVIVPFYCDLKPKRPENCQPDDDAFKVNRTRLCEAMTSGLDADRAADLFEEWYNKLCLGVHKRISPLAHNWLFDRSFMIDWLGEKTFNYHFDGRYRDTMVAALFENDFADFHAEACPYAKVNLAYLASTLKVENMRAHDALHDCVTTAEIYRRMLVRK